MKNMVSDLNVCRNKGLSERFDSTIGAATVLMPFGGSMPAAPPSTAMVAKLPVDGETNDLLRHGMGLQPLPHRARTSIVGAYGWPSSRVADQAGGRRLPAMRTPT